MAALAFQSITVGHAHTMVASLRPPQVGACAQQIVTRTRARRLFQSMRNRPEPTASEEPPGVRSERTSDPPPLDRPATGCGSRRAPETGFEPLEPRRGRFKSIGKRVSQFRFGPPELAGPCCLGTSERDPACRGGALSAPLLNAFRYNPTHLVQPTSTRCV